MEKVVIANFKMNKTIRQTKEYLGELIDLTQSSKGKIGICPPLTALKSATTRARGTKILIGAQNMHAQESGAFTGEVSGEMIKEAGADFVLVGHSERRKYNNETNAEVNQKVLKCLKIGLTVVMCVGETLAERGQDKTDFILQTQLGEGLKDVYGNEMKNIIIAYEPVWSIGTGKIPTAVQISSAMKTIKSTIERLYGKETTAIVPVLYGGSVNESNSKDIAKIKEVDGALVGGAGLDVSKFNTIIKNFGLTN